MALTHHIGSMIGTSHAQLHAELSRITRELQALPALRGSDVGPPPPAAPSRVPGMVSPLACQAEVNRVRLDLALLREVLYRTAPR